MRWRAWFRRSAVLALLVIVVIDEVKGWGFRDLWRWANWWEPEIYWAHFVEKIWPPLGYSLLFAALVAYAGLWVWRWRGGRNPRLRASFRRIPGMRPTLSVVLSAPGQPGGAEQYGFAALVNEERRRLEMRDRHQKLQIATPIHSFGDYVSPLTHAPGDTGWLAVLLIAAKRILPSEDLTVRATLHGSAPGITLELYTRNALRISTSLWHPPSLDIPLSVEAEHAMTFEETAHLFATPTAAWIQEYLNSCPAKTRRRSSCEQIMHSGALVVQGVKYYDRHAEFSERSYKLALQVDAGQLSARFNLAMIDLDEQRFDQCIARLDQIIRESNRETDRVWYYAMYNLGTAWLHRALAGKAPRAGILQALHYRQELVEAGDEFLTAQGWGMTGEKPATDRAPIVASLPWTNAEWLWKLRRRLKGCSTRGRRRIEDALRRDGPIGIAATATAIACALDRELIEPARARSALADRDACVRRAVTSLEDIDDASRLASVRYNLACYYSVSGNLEQSAEMFGGTLEVTDVGARAERLVWALKDPTLANLKESDRFSQIVKRFGLEAVVERHSKPDIAFPTDDTTQAARPTRRLNLVPGSEAV